jgi:uncharacterized protein YjiS (DUF1127 family)
MSIAAVQTAPACAGERPRLFSIGRALRDACRRFWLAERTRRELSSLTDLDLRDIGITRGDIPYVAAQVDNLR